MLSLERSHQSQAGDVGRPGTGDVAAIVGDGPRGGCQELGQEVEAGGLAGTVWTDQRVNRAPANDQIDAIDCSKPSELYRQATGLKNDIAGCHPTSPL
jgi:hypothetical protein